MLVYLTLEAQVSVLALNVAIVGEEIDAQLGQK